MEFVKIENLSFTYPGRDDKALDNISFSIEKGDFVTVCGQSGCGKTTLLRLLKTAVSPEGNMEGSINIGGRSIDEISLKEQAEMIGFVFQNPDRQTVCDSVYKEMAFGLENLGYDSEKIRTKVSEMASFFGIEKWFYDKCDKLSGGQKQLLNLASVMVLNPEILILDEPASQLDPIAAQDFIRILQKINRELSVTVIISEHRLEDVLPFSDSVVVLDRGKLSQISAPDEMGGILKKENHPMLYAMPTPVRVAAETGEEKTPVSVRDGRKWLSGYLDKFGKNDINFDDEENYKKDVALGVKDVFFKYEKNGRDIVKGANFNVYKGEIFALMGGNGTGKTTMLTLLAGVKKPYRGKIVINGKNISDIKNLHGGCVGMMVQNPLTVLSHKNVYSELWEMISDKDISEEEKKKLLDETASLCSVKKLYNVHPYDISGGEQQRVLLCKILLAGPEILLLDEPAKGMDAHFKKQFANILKNLKKQGKTIILVSHDIEFCAMCADRCALFFDGAVTSQGKVREFFTGNNFYTTAACRMASMQIEGAVTTEDILLALGKEDSFCGHNDEEKEEIKKDENPPLEKKEKVTKYQIKKEKKGNILPLFLLLLAVPLTMYFGQKLPFDRKYYFISLLIIFETVAVFFADFEGKKPSAREMTLISVLCAIAVAGRAAFFMLPQFKPFLAVVIISGICLGGRSGFLIGAISAFVSNFFFSQGPWTPWQMFACGLTGLVAGVVFSKEFIKKNRIYISIFGFLSCFLLYGAVLNPSHVLQSQMSVNFKMILATYISGFPFDMIHGLSTALFLWLISEIMIEKIERVCRKSGIKRN